jgi:hypothetical protein
MSTRFIYNARNVGNRHGRIKFGKLQANNEVAAIQLINGRDAGRHYMTMTATGDKESGQRGSTQFVSPGSFIIDAGRDIKETPIGEENGNQAFAVRCENGDVLIQAKDGAIKLEAESIELISSSGDPQKGRITLNASETIELKAPDIVANATNYAKIVSDGTLDVLGMKILNLYGGFLECADGATSVIGSKGGSTLEDRARNGFKGG